MKARPQRDWAERTAERIMWVHANDLADWPWGRRLKLRGALLCALRRAENRGYQRGKSDGYAEGHEDQMKMRVLDTIERIDGKLARVEAQAKLIRGARERDRSEG